MSRTGRPRTPDVVKRIKGNRRKERLAPPEPRFALPPADAVAGQLGDAPPLQSDGAPDTTPMLAPVNVPVPEFLTKPREREIYLRVMTEFVPRQIARSTDAPAYARWAAHFARWLMCKEILDHPDAGSGFYWVESKHGKRMAEHPAFKMMMVCELAITRLELQLGLTPLSRQSIIRGMGALAAAQAALFNDSDKPKDVTEVDATPGRDQQSPLDFLANVAAATPTNQ